MCVLGGLSMDVARVCHGRQSVYCKLKHPRGLQAHALKSLARHICLKSDACMHACMRMQMSVAMCVGVCVCICMYIYIYLYLYLYLYNITYADVRV